MTDFEYINEILNEKFLCPPPFNLQLREDKGTDNLLPQIVEIEYQPGVIEHVNLYRFDMEESNFLPFFNNKGNPHEKHAPKGLVSFCDYIILIEYKEQLCIILAELKRGTKTGYEDQLNAGLEFIKYVLNSAERIKTENDMDSFESKNVILRRVLLERTINNKRITKPKDLNISKREKEGIIKYKSYNTLPIRYFI